MQADVPAHEPVDQSDEGDLGVGPVAEAAAEGEEKGDVASVDSGMREPHDLDWR